MKNIDGLAAIGALCLASLLARPAAAQLVPLGPEIVVAAGNELGLQCPQVLGHADRSFSVVWTQNPQVDQYSIVAQRFDGAGTPQGGRIDVDAGSLQHRRWAETQAANRGALGDIVTWSSYLPSSPDTMVRFDSRVLSAPAPARVVTPSYVHRLFPRTGGGYLGSWAARNACSFALLDAKGHPASPAVRLDGSYPDFFCVQATQAANGSFTVDWYHPNGAPSDRFRRFGPAARPLGPESRPEDVDPASISVASAPDGRIALAWARSEYDQQGAIGPLRTQFFGADGRPLGPAMTVDTPATPAASYFQDAVAMDRQGRALILWHFLAFDPFVERYSLQLQTPAGSASPVL
ncbi:MAG TPA: hypothetical protein VGG20_23805, partial [Thermoanaerobaculia bacterium]